MTEIEKIVYVNGKDAREMGTAFESGLTTFGTNNKFRFLWEKGWLETDSLKRTSKPNFNKIYNKIKNIIKEID